MVVSLNSALNSNSRATYNPSVINFGKNEFKNTAYLKEAPKAEAKHASRFARAVTKGMFGMMGLIGFAGCSGNNYITPEPEIPKTKTPILELYTKFTNAIGLSKASDKEVFESALYQQDDGVQIQKAVNHKLTSDDTLYVDLKNSEGRTTQLKVYKNPTSDNLIGKDNDGIVELTLNDKGAKPIVTEIDLYRDLKVEYTKGVVENTMDAKAMTKSGKLVSEQTVKILKTAVKSIK